MREHLDVRRIPSWTAWPDVRPALQPFGGRSSGWRSSRTQRRRFLEAGIRNSDLEGIFSSKVLKCRPIFDRIKPHPPILSGGKSDAFGTPKPAYWLRGRFAGWDAGGSDSGSATRPSGSNRLNLPVEELGAPL
jgi:hypothetical protein